MGNHADLPIIAVLKLILLLQHRKTHTGYYGQMQEQRCRKHERMGLTAGQAGTECAYLNGGYG